MSTRLQKNNAKRIRAYNNKWHKDNRQKALQRRREQAKANPERTRGIQIKKFWPGSTWREANSRFNSLLKSQEGACAIYKQVESALDHRTGKPRALSVDHCHETRQVRGLLCHRCNKAIGEFRDSPALCYTAGNYLMRGESLE